MTEKSAAIASPAPPVTGNAAYLAAQWAQARQVYPIYAGLAKDFGLAGPCPELESTLQEPKPEHVQRARGWLDEMDDRIRVQHLRRFLQSALHQNPSEKALRGLVLRHLLRPKKHPADGEKIDYLLVQYFALCAPPEISSQPVQLATVAEVLKPLLGRVEIRPLEWFAQLEELVQGLAECTSLRDILETGYLEQGRELKTAAGDTFYNPTALVAFVRFNFLVRRAFIQLMHADLAAIRDTLQQLESAGVRTVDCHSADLSSAESIGALRQFCAGWTQPFARSYSENSVGQSFGKLLAIRNAVEAALKRPRTEPPTARAASQQQQAPAIPPRTFAKSNLKSLGNKPAAPARGRKFEPAAGLALAALEERIENGATKLDVASAVARANAGAAAEPAVASAAVVVDADACMETIWEQLIAETPTRGRSMTSVVYLNTKILLSSWEVNAFVSDRGKTSEDLRRAVVARMLVAVAMDTIKNSGAFPGLKFTLDLAHAETRKLQGCVEQAKAAKNTEAAVNLGITAKRLMAYVEEAENLQG
jgi:hypothetical protein